MCNAHIERAPCSSTTQTASWPTQVGNHDAWAPDAWATASKPAKDVNQSQTSHNQPLCIAAIVQNHPAYCVATFVADLDT